MASRRPARRNSRSGNKSKKDAQLSAREQMNKNDNKMAMQILGGCLVGALLIFGMFMMSDDPQPEKRKERRRGPTEIIGDNRPSPLVESVVPIWLAERFMIALASEDEEAVSKLMAWDLLFGKIDSLNNRQPGERYADLDAAAKKKMQARYLEKVIDPDFAQLIRDNALEDLKEGIFMNTNDIGDDYGNVNMMVEDSRGRPKLLIQVKTQLLPGMHTVRDAKNREAWGIVTILHQLQGQVNSEGTKIRMRKKDFAENLFKKKKKRKKRRPAGPPEADPSQVEWPEGMGQGTKSQIESQVAALIQDDDFRKADQAKFALMDRGKAAIPGLLRAMSQLDFEEDKSDVAKSFQIIQTLREITGMNFNFRPMMTKQGLGMGGMTRATPEERVKAVRRWYGWWEVNKKTWTKKVAPKEPESWDDLVEDEDKDKKKKKK